MNVDTISGFISSVGFPIAAYAALFWYVIKSSKDHKEEVSKLSEALNNNTMVMERLCEKVGGNSHDT